jgi:hypothetical protein
MDLNHLEKLTEWFCMEEGAVFKKFRQFSADATIRGRGQEKFIYIRGSRQNRVLLVAHADTVWGNKKRSPKSIEFKDGRIYSNVPDVGIGADDRAGCAIVWELRESGHSLLITAGEEVHCAGSQWLMSKNPDIAQEINQGHQFAVEFDRRNATDFKCYNVGTDEFRRYIALKTGYSEPDRTSFTDICILCQSIPGVNLSVGYENEHNANETLILPYWACTLALVEQWLSDPKLPGFKLPEAGDNASAAIRGA